VALFDPDSGPSNDQKSWENCTENGYRSPYFFVKEKNMDETAAVILEQAEAAPVPAPAVSTEQAPTMTLSCYGGKLTREQLSSVPTPRATATHKPIAHIEVVEKLIEALSFRQIGVVREEYAVSADGMKMFGVMDLTSGFQGCRFAIGLRNSHDKSFRLSCTVGLRVFVCENLAFHGEYTPVLAKHSKNFLLEDSLAVGVDRIQRNFGPLQQQVEQWQSTQLSDPSAKLLIYQAFIEEEAGFPKHLARRVHELYFRPIHVEFQARTMWSLSNAFTSAFKELEPIPQYRATAKLAGFLQSIQPS
jgi:Domain of unknown function (DUF932)